MILSAPAPATRNVPVVSPIRLVDPQGPAGAKTILFKNVLDGLEAFEIPGDENVAGEQNAVSQGPIPQGTTSNNTTSNKMSGAPVTGKALPDQAPVPQPHIAAQHVVPQIPFPSQNLAQLTATPALPTQETAQPKQASSAQSWSAQSSSVTDAEPPSTGVDAQPSDVKRSTLPSAALPSQSLPSSHRITLAPAARFSVSIQTPNTPANSAPAKSSGTEAKMVAAPAPLVSTVSASVSVESTSDATPVVISPKAQTKEVAESPVASGPAQVKSTTGPPSDVLPAPQAKGRVANNTPAVKSEMMPRESRAVAPARSEATPKENIAASPLPAPKEPTRKAAAVENQSNRSTPAPRPTSTPAQVPEQRQTTAPSSPVETASAATPATRLATTMVTTPLPATTMPIAQPPPASTKSKDASSRRTLSSESTPSDPIPSNNALSTSVPPPVTQAAPVPGPVTEKTTPASRTADSSATQRSDATEVPVIAGDTPKTPLAPSAENLAFAVRMLAPENAPSSVPLAQTEPAAAVTQPQIIEPKPATTASGTQVQQPQSQTSSNSKLDTPAPATAPEKTDNRAPKAAALPQPADTWPTATRWSEVSVPQPSELSSTRFSAELAEPAHASPALAAQETRLMAPELPKTSTSSEILLHLAGNDQSSAAIRVADRAGSVNVTVHASDPVLRESLRSNLGELSTQLSQQGWKAETVKPAAIAAQPESQQDSHSGGQRSSQQQQSFGGDRQPQRDRRTQAGQWQQELEQQTSSGNAHPGGNR